MVLGFIPIGSLETPRGVTQSEYWGCAAAQPYQKNVKLHPDPNQPMFAFAAPVCTPRGDGSFVVSPGKPLSRLTTDQFAREIGVSAESVRRYIQEGVIPPEMVECAGHRKYLIHAAAVQAVKVFFQKRLAM